MASPGRATGRLRLEDSSFLAPLTSRSWECPEEPPASDSCIYNSIHVYFVVIYNHQHLINVIHVSNFAGVKGTCGPTQSLAIVWQSFGKPLRSVLIFKQHVRPLAIVHAVQPMDIFWFGAIWHIDVLFLV